MIKNRAKNNKISKILNLISKFKQMKTSNIILSAVFASILIWIFAAFITAKAKITEFIEQHPEIVKEKKEDIKRETVQLEAFHTIIVKGEGDLFVEQSESCSFDQFIDENNTAEVRNDTLFINVIGQKCRLNVSEISNVLTKDKVWVEISNLETDTFKIFTTNDSHLKINDLKVKFLSLTSEDNSKVELQNVNYENTEAEFYIRNFSEVSVDNTKGMALSVKKGPQAKYKDD